MVGAIAAGLGYALRFLLALLHALPGLVGPAAIVTGIWAFDWRIATIVGGLILWAWDLRPGRASTLSKDDEA